MDIIIYLIKEFIKDSDSRKISFDTLYKTLENKPYSVRKGIIPVLLSMALKDYSDNLILSMFLYEKIKDKIIIF